MKYTHVITVMACLFTLNLSAVNYYQSLCSRISNMGQAIENVNNAPVIGKLTNLVPFAALAASLKKCPMQTMAILAALGVYVLSYNSTISEMIEQYEFTSTMPWIRKKTIIIVEEPVIDDNFFVYDEEDEDELLGYELIEFNDSAEKKILQ